MTVADDVCVETERSVGSLVADGDVGPLHAAISRLAARAESAGRAGVITMPLRAATQVPILSTS